MPGTLARGRTMAGVALAILGSLGGARADQDPGAPAPCIRVLVPELAGVVTRTFEAEGGLQGFVAEVGPGVVLTPAVEERRVCAGTGMEMRCFDALTGELLWRQKTDDSWPSAPAIRRGRVFYNTQSCTLYSAEMASGGRNWSHWIAGSVATTVTLDGDRVYVTGPGKDGFKIECLDAVSGRLIYTRVLPADALSAPVVADGRVFLALGDGSVASLDAGDGKTVWSKDMKALAAPWLHEGRLLVASGSPGSPDLADVSAATGEGGRGVATPVPSGGAGEKTFVAGEEPPGRRGGGRAAPAAPRPPAPVAGPRPDTGSPGQDPKEKDRRNPVPAPAGPTGSGNPAVPGSGSFGYEGPRPCVAAGVVAMAAGSTLSLRPLGGAGAALQVALPEAAAGGAVAAGECVVVATRDGRILGFDPATGARRFSLLFVTAGAKGGPVPFSSSPAVVRGRAYIGTSDGRLLGTDLPDPAADGWPMWGGGPSRVR